MRTRRPVLLVLAAALVALVAPAGAAQAAVTPAQVALANLTLAQRVGQLFLVGTPADGTSQQAAAQIGARHIGGIILTGRSRSGITATARVTTALQGRATWNATAGVPMLIAADQEGGQVQVLSGPGFSIIPTALTQGGWSTAELRTRAAEWGGQLRRAGVNLDLAPVYGTVPSRAVAPQNAPIAGTTESSGSTRPRWRRTRTPSRADWPMLGWRPPPSTFPGWVGSPATPTPLPG